MSKLSFFFVTLIAAVPAGILGYLAVMAFLGHSGEMPVILMGVTGLMLLTCAIAVAMPVAALLRRGPKAEEMEEAEAAPAADDNFEDQDEEVVAEDEDAEVYAEDEDMDFDAFEEDEKNR